MPLLWRFFLVILTFLHPGSMVKNRRLPLAKAMCVNRFTRAKAETSPFSTVRITLLTTLMADYADETDDLPGVSTSAAILAIATHSSVAGLSMMKRAEWDP